MSIIRKVSDCIYYYADSFKAVSFKAKVEHFKVDPIDRNINVIYRLGRQKLLNKMVLSQFEHEYFEALSNYDQRRIVKFSTLQSLLQDLFCDSQCSREKFFGFIEDQARNEQHL